MLNIPTELQARLDSGATTLAWCWRVERRDGQVSGFTDHDGDLVFDGVTYRAATGLSGADIDTRLGRESGSGEVSGVFEDSALRESDLANGVWSGAQVQIYRTDWSDVSLRVKVWTGELGEVRHDGVSFRADLNGLSRRLERSIGRIYSRHCDASFGDARCGLDASLPAYRGAGMVTGQGPAGFVVSGLSGFAEGWFSSGWLDWTSGAASGQRQRVISHHVSGGQVLIKLEGDNSASGIGDGFVVTAGCDKRHATCRDKFANILNFRGFAFLPGNDVLMASPASDKRRDGGSRGLS
ncbi:MAG: DUF2163 domain-containing protein [Alphaproteobacteria bacterium]|nr:DUF2163 domain-containing protein [Alphaproteobacteria bacterium]